MSERDKDYALKQVKPILVFCADHFELPEPCDYSTGLCGASICDATGCVRWRLSLIKTAEANK